ncbi:HAD family hydrolase [Pseudomonas aeruginosa]
MFDKTGTLTLGQPDVVEMVAAPGVEETRLLRDGRRGGEVLRAPLALAVLKRAGDMPTEVTENFTNIDGQGARATIGGETVLWATGR